MRGAQVSEKRCGFIVNAGGATTADILALIGKVRRRWRFAFRGAKEDAQGREQPDRIWVRR